MNLTSEKKAPDGALIQVYSICLDWFQANLTGVIPTLDLEQTYELNQITLITEKYGSKHFDRRARVQINGIELGEIKYNPRSKEIIQENTIIFKANNQALYDKNFLEYFEVFFKELELNFSHINKMDLACDGSGFMKPLIQADQGLIEWVGKGDFQPFKKNKKIGLEYQGFWLGSKKGDKFGRCYLKKEELAKSGKLYIESFWQMNDLYAKTGTTNIERLEFSLGNKEIKKWIPRGTWEETKALIKNSEFIAKLFNSVSKTLFSFREKRKNIKQNVSRLKKLFKLDFSLFGEITLLDKIINIGTKRLRAFKTSCKTMYEVGLKTGIEFYEKQALEFAQNINHLHWFRKSRERWENEFKRDKKKGLTYIPIFTSSMISSLAGKFFKDTTQYKIQDETQIDKLLEFWNKKEFAF